MDFWKKFEHLILSSEVIIDRPKGSRHPKFEDFIYPCDYGYLKGTASTDGNEIDVCCGSKKDQTLTAIICTVDLLKKDSEVKLLLGCSDYDIKTIEHFFNDSKYMSGIVIRNPYTAR